MSTSKHALTANISIEIDSEDTGISATSTADFSVNLTLPKGVTRLGLQSYRVQGMPTIQQYLNDRLVITKDGTTNYLITLNPGRYGADSASNTAKDNIVTELQRAIDAASISDDIVVDYDKAANRITMECDQTGYTIRIHADCPRLGGTIGLFPDWRTEWDISTNDAGNQLPFTPTLLLTRYIDIHSIILQRYNPTDALSQNQSSSLLYRIFLQPPTFRCMFTDPQIEQIMY